MPLMAQVARIGSKQFPTAQALASSRALHHSAPLWADHATNYRAPTTLRTRPEEHAKPGEENF
jgi:hypothetical protein